MSVSTEANASKQTLLLSCLNLHGPIVQKSKHIQRRKLQNITGNNYKFRWMMGNQLQVLDGLGNQEPGAEVGWDADWERDRSGGSGISGQLAQELAGSRPKSLRKWSRAARRFDIAMGLAFL